MASTPFASRSVARHLVRGVVGRDVDLATARQAAGLAAGNIGGVLVRVPPEQSDRLVESTSARPMEMRGRPMTGWLHVETDAVTDDAALERWVGIGVGYARTLD